VEQLNKAMFADLGGSDHHHEQTEDNASARNPDAASNLDPQDAEEPNQIFPVLQNKPRRDSQNTAAFCGSPSKSIEFLVDLDEL
jgi:hypothetical protein